MLAIIPLAGYLGWVKREANNQRRAIDEMKAYGANVKFRSSLNRNADRIEDPLVDWYGPVQKASDTKPSWLERKLGPEYVQRIGQVSFASVRAPERLVTEGSRGSVPVGFFNSLKRLGALETLEFNGVGVRRQDILNASEISSLKALDLTHCSIDEDAFTAVGQTGIEKLALSTISKRLSEFDWSGLSRIKELRVSSNANLELDPRPFEFLRMLPNLHTLDLRYSYLDGSDLSPIYHAQTLRVLVLSDTFISDSALTGLESLQNLESLAFNNDRQLGLSGAPMLSRLQKLRRLELAYTAFGDDGLQSIRNLPQLRVLDLRDSRVTGGGIAKIGLPRSLRRLNLQFHSWFGKSSIDDQSMQSVGKLDQLRELLLENSGITDAGFAFLNPLHQLERASLANTKISDFKGLEPSQLSMLSELDLTGTKLSDAGFAKLCLLPALKSLRVGNSKLSTLANAELKNLRKLVELDLGKTGVGDADLAQLTPLKGLRYLYLRNTSITDAGLDHLESLPALEVLDIGANTGITDAGLDKLSRLKSLRYIQIDGLKALSAAAIARFQKSRPEVQIEQSNSDALAPPRPQ